ncbi:MAG: hypothetical protein JNK04_10785, partial [Myxococcales bacterium]|nr:hypothetical protein [Myxococcales bacterium]
MMRRRACVLLFSAGCTASSTTTEAPHHEVVIAEPLAPSSLPALGVTEAVTGAAGGERAVRAVTGEVGACVKPAVEREPTLTGTIAFRIEPGAGATKPATGTLAALPVAACLRDALRTVKTTGVVDYSLTFNGNPSPQPLNVGALLNIDWAAIDWSATGPDAPAALAKTGETLRDRFRRCAFGAEPLLSEKAWLAVRVANGGAATVGIGKPGDASDCIQRALRATTFPDAGHDYAFSVMLRPGPPTDTAENDKQEFGMIGLFNSGAADDTSARGNIWGDEIGDSYGAGGLGLT